METNEGDILEQGHEGDGLELDNSRLNVHPQLKEPESMNTTDANEILANNEGTQLHTSDSNGRIVQP